MCHIESFCLQASCLFPCAVFASLTLHGAKIAYPDQWHWHTLRIRITYPEETGFSFYHGKMPGQWFLQTTLGPRNLSWNEVISLYLCH